MNPKRTSLLKETAAIKHAARKANAAVVRKMASKYNCSERRIYRVLNNEIPRKA